MRIYDDPLMDYEAYERKKHEVVDRYPVCDHCNDPITDEHLYLINDCFVCEECLKDYYRRDTDDYIEK